MDKILEETKVEAHKQFPEMTEDQIADVAYQICELSRIIVESAGRPRTVSGGFPSTDCEAAALGNAKNKSEAAAIATRRRHFMYPSRDGANSVNLKSWLVGVILNMRKFSHPRMGAHSRCEWRS